MRGREAVGSDHSFPVDPEQLTDTQPGARLGHLAGRSDIVGMLWVLGSGLAILVPVFLHGWILGPFDLISRNGLTAHPGVPLHIYSNPDLIDSLIPWWDTVWQQVHAGHLPLWNPYGGLGMPLAFNWQSAPFSLPALIGYLAPLRDAFTVGVVVNILVAGSGAYVLGRVLGMGAVASAAVGTVFELSGPMAAWLGYPFPAVMCWAGWIFAVGWLLLRGRQHRAGYVVALAAFTALALDGGAPEGFTVLMTAALVFFAVVLLCRTRWLGGSGEILRPAIDLVVGTIAGGALAAPFALPGFQLSSQSVRNHASVVGTLRPHALAYLAIPAFDGLPIFHGGRVAVFGYTYYYAETAMYVGVSALVLGGLAVVLLRRRPEVRGFAVVVVLCLAVVFVPPVTSLAGKLPVLGRVSSLRALMPMALALAVLCGFGLDLVVRSSEARKAGRWLGVGFGIAALALLGTWLFGGGGLGPVNASVRAHSFIWPAIETFVGLGAAGFLIWAGGSAAGLASGSHRVERTRDLGRSDNTITGNDRRPRRAGRADCVSRQFRRHDGAIEPELVSPDAGGPGPRPDGWIGDGGVRRGCRLLRDGGVRPQRQRRLWGARTRRLRPDNPQGLLLRVAGRHRFVPRAPLLQPLLSDGGIHLRGEGVRGGLRPRAIRPARSRRKRLCPTLHERGSLPHPRVWSGDGDAAVTRRASSGQRPGEADPGAARNPVPVGAQNLLGRPTGPSAPSHQCPGLARLDGRKAAGARGVRRDDVAGQDPGGGSHDRSALLARDPHVRHRAGAL